MAECKRKESISPMIILTVNVPESYIETIEKLIDKNGLYPSRSELVRVAVREFLIKELKLLRTPIPIKPELKDIEIQIPSEKINENDEPIREFKTYNVIKVLKSEAKEPTYTQEKPRPYFRKQPIGNIHHPDAQYPAVLKDWEVEE